MCDLFRHNRPSALPVPVPGLNPSRSQTVWLLPRELFNLLHGMGARRVFLDFVVLLPAEVTIDADFGEGNAEEDYLLEAEAGAALVVREAGACPVLGRTGSGDLLYCGVSAGAGSARSEGAGLMAGAEVVDRHAASRAPSRIIGASTR